MAQLYSLVSFDLHIFPLKKSPQNGSFIEKKKKMVDEGKLCIFLIYTVRAHTYLIVLSTFPQLHQLEKNDFICVSTI